MYSLNGSGIPCLSSYQEALTYWSNAHQWKGMNDEHDHRALARNGKRRKWLRIRKKKDDAIACRYYDTELVTYNKDDTITLRPHRSMSSDIFCNRLLPAGVHSSFNYPTSTIIFEARIQTSQWRGADSHIYQVNQEFTIERAPDDWPTRWRIIGETKPFKRRLIDRAKANAALKKYDFATFKAWLMAAIRLSPAISRSNYFGHHECLSLLARRESWTEFLGRDPHAVLDRLRQEIYRYEDCYYEETADFLVGWKTFSTWRTSRH